MRISRRAVGGTVAFALIGLPTAACSGPDVVHPVGYVALGRLHIDPVSRCSWLGGDGGELRVTVWIDGTQTADGRPPALIRDHHVVARAGDEVQATMYPYTDVDGVERCPLPRGTKVIAVAEVRVRPTGTG